MFSCTKCRREYEEFRYLCDCGGVLLWHGESLKWKPLGSGIWRYAGMLPDVGLPITLREGETPLVKRRDIPGRVYMKLEGDNPTGSFKDRGTTVVVSHARHTHYKSVCVASTGNMGASVAAYAAYGNMGCRVFAPKDTPSEKLAQIAAYNAELCRVNGYFAECVDAAMKETKKGAYLAMTGLNPYYIEGEKTVAFEIYEDIGVPDKIIMPVGTGGLLTAIFKGFRELHDLHVIRKLPKMIGVQPKGCSPIVDALREGHEEPKHIRKAKTIASAVLVKTPFNGRTAIRAMKESRGFGVEVTDHEIIRGIRELGREGVFAEPAAATSIAALDKIGAKKDEKIVLVVTGHGLKDPRALFSA